jgi:hypothetical protein
LLLPAGVSKCAAHTVLNPNWMPTEKWFPTLCVLSPAFFRTPEEKFELKSFNIYWHILETSFNTEFWDVC